MFYVNLYQNNEIVISTPFEEKENAIRFFNYKIDQKNIKGFDYFDFIELLKDSCVLFDCEV